MTSINKLLFTPGPLTTSATVKTAMLRDAGARDKDFLSVVHEIRERLLSIGGQPPPQSCGEYECIPMQGSGTFAVESVISSAIPGNGKLLVLANGAYGRRIAQMARIHGIETVVMETPENRKISPDAVRERLTASADFTHVAVIHCETTTGIVNPIDEIGEVVVCASVVYIVDAMSSFGAFPIDLAAAHIDFLISSANKCIEGVPGFGFVLARRSRLLEAKGLARTLSLDLYAQWAEMETDNQFRFTPPTHALLAFRQALLELEAEGGPAGRAARYRANHATLMRGMTEMGFDPYLAPEDISYIITVFIYPANPCFCYEEFYQRLSQLGFIIYSGKLTSEPCFRIGTLGHLFPSDIEALLTAMRRVLEKMEVMPAVGSAN